MTLSCGCRQDSLDRFSTEQMDGASSSGNVTATGSVNRPSCIWNWSGLQHVESNRNGFTSRYYNAPTVDARTSGSWSCNCLLSLLIFCSWLFPASATNPNNPSSKNIVIFSLKTPFCSSFVILRLTDCSHYSTSNRWAKRSRILTYMLLTNLI